MKVTVCSLLVVLFWLFAAGAPAAWAGEKETIEDVVFVRNHDGDTFVAELGPPGSMPEVVRVLPVRLRGIDTPEKNPKCKNRKRNLKLQKQAKKAEARLFKILSKAKRIDLVDVKRGRNFRLVADVLADGKDVAKKLIRARLAKKAGAKRLNWCRKK